MLKLTKKADYGLIAVKHLAEFGEQGSCSAKDIADEYAIPQAAMAKILQKLVKSGLLVSHHGINGGYVLARSPKNISALEVIRAIDGPLFITSCGDEARGCYQSRKCTVREPLRKVNESIQQVLSRISIADLKEKPQDAEEAMAKNRPRELITLTSQ